MREEVKERASEGGGEGEMMGVREEVKERGSEGGGEGEMRE